MEVLKDWEMFKNMEMLKEMQHVNRDTNPSGATVQNSLPPKQKETVR
jgi:hypothetical protein